MRRDNRLDNDDIERDLPFPVPAGASTDDAQEGEEAEAPARQRRSSGRRRQAETSDEGQQEAASTNGARPAEIPRLRQMYMDEVAPALMQEFNFTNAMRVPKVTKIVLNIGAGDARDEARVLEGIQRDLTTISGQKPVVTRARNSIAGFHIREGNTIGASVTLRGARMWNFLDRLMNVALPRTRDFRGVSTRAFDRRGNYSVGLREQIIFPEIDYNRVDRIRGLQVNIVTTAQTDDEGLRLLALLGMPFAREEITN